MKIVFIADNISKGKDGVGDHTRKLWAEFNKNNVETFFLTSSSSSFDKDCDSKKVPKTSKWGFSCIKQVLIDIKRINPDWIFLQYVPFAFHKRGMAFWLCFLFMRLRLANYKISIFFHEVSDRLYFPNFKTMILGIAQRFLANILTWISNTSFTSIEFYQRYFLFKPAVVSIGSNISIERMSELRNTSDEFIISTFGSRGIHEFEMFMQAIESIKRKGHPVKALILGHTSHFDKLFHRIYSSKQQELFVLTGFVEEDALAKYLTSSHIFINLNSVDRKGRGGMCLKSGSLAAAFASGLAIIGFKGDMTDKLLVNRGNVLLCDKFSHSCLEQAIQLVINQPNLRQSLQENARKFYEQHLSWKIIYDKTISKM